MLLIAVLLVSVSCSMASRGTMPPARPNGVVDASHVPDFIAYVGQTDHIIGWVPKEYLLEATHGDGPIPVYAGDLRTLIGHDFPGKGFVPLGRDPAAATDAPFVVAPSAGP
jgi:hypothetical protein